MEHEFSIELTLPITRKEADALLAGERRVFRKVDPFSSQVSSAAIGCVVCGKGGVEAIFLPDCPGAPVTPEPEEESDGTVEDN